MAAGKRRTSRSKWPNFAVVVFQVPRMRGTWGARRLPHGLGVLLDESWSTAAKGFAASCVSRAD